jgi:hypothetical protein
MKKIILPFAILFTIAACNNSDKKNGQTHSGNEPKTLVDSLMDDINKVHDNGMSKMYKLTSMQQQTRRAIDSINQLPDGLKNATASYTQTLDSLLKDLEYAEFAMDKWMPEYYANTDTLADNNDERVKYLTTEKIKASKIMEAILNGIQKADSLLKVKF